MAIRKVAFSFENRRSSVTSLIVILNKLFVGTRSGVVNMLEVDTALLVSSFNYHPKAVSSIVVRNGTLNSAGMDGLIFEYCPDDTFNAS